jgi:ribonuclease P protein component
MAIKVSNNLPSDDPSARKYSLSRKNILRGKKNFQRIFGKGIHLHAKTIDLRFLLFSDSNEGFRMGFVASKRLGNAVKRNHIKRLMREAYRLNQHILSEFCNNTIGLHGVLIAKNTDSDFKTVENDCINLLKQVRKHIQNTL